MKIIYTESAEQYLKDLVDILYYENYFSFETSAVEYVNTLTIEVESTIHIRQKHRAPVHFSKYGKDLYYITCPKTNILHSIYFSLTTPITIYIT